jgi:type I restriction enzyme M protein
MSEQQQVQQQLWKIANELRGKMDANEFKDYMLGFIFYKYLSEKMLSFANDLLKEDGITYSSATDEAIIEVIRKESIAELGYFLKPQHLFSSIANRSGVIIEDLESILNDIEQSTQGGESEEDFGNLFEDLDLNSSKLGKTVEARNTLVQKILQHLNQIDFELQNSESDVLGDAYEYLISQFASSAGKKAGEFYTPQEVSTILAKIVANGKTKLKNVYDPTCGSGSLLLRVAKEVEYVSEFYGQELNRTTYNLARMNMIMHGVHYKRFDIRQDDTLENPQHLSIKFDAIVANPPFSVKWSHNDIFMGDERFSKYGRLAPKDKADYAFVTHMIHHLSENGTLATLMPHGALFRGKAEGVIRKFIIDDLNYLDAVIGLPSAIFYGTPIPTCIMVFKKNRVNSENVLFIDASKEIEKAKNQNLIKREHIDRIIKVYTERKEEDKFSSVISLETIKENEYNLNISRYVDVFDDDKLIDLENVVSELKSLKNDISETDKIISDFCNKLNINPPY